MAQNGVEGTQIPFPAFFEELSLLGETTIIDPSRMSFKARNVSGEPLRTSQGPQHSVVALVKRLFLVRTRRRQNMKQALGPGDYL